MRRSTCRRLARALIHGDHLPIEGQPAVELPLLEAPLMHRPAVKSGGAAISYGAELVKACDELFQADLPVVVRVEHEKHLFDLPLSKAEIGELGVHLGHVERAATIRVDLPEDGLRLARHLPPQ